MKLSEAIRLGATLSPQAISSDLPPHKRKERCTLEGAAEAIGLPAGAWGNGELSKQLPFLRAEAECPVQNHWMCHEVMGRRVVMNVCWHLNDFHQWSRERIADHIELLELAAEQPLLEEVEVGQ